MAWSDNGRDFLAVGTGQPFAWKQDDWLYEYGSGKPLGWFQGDSFFEHPGGKQLFFIG